jgi:putative transposase
MPNTYTQIYIQFVFTVKYRNGVIEKYWKDQLYKYITGTVNALGHKLIAINGVEDHIHILVGYKPVQSFSDLMKAVKQNSSKWINDNNFTKRKFEWQEGYGAFSYGQSQLSRIVKYIDNQEIHHKNTTFHDEYIAFLEKFEIDYNEKYIFQELI